MQNWKTCIQKRKKLTGILLPLFSLPPNSKKQIQCDFISFAKQVLPYIESGIKAFQILPVQETFSNSPYDTKSSMAINPVYLCTRQVCGEPIYANYSKFPYYQIRKKKLKLAKSYFFAHRRQILQSKKIKQWIEQEVDWFYPFAAFSILEKRFGKNWRKWPEQYKKPCSNLYKLFALDKDEFFFLAWIQFHLEKQLLEMKTILNEKGVYLKGDMPFAMNLRSVDIWQNQDLVDFQYVVGAPPDQFSKKGQNWQFPRWKLEKAVQSKKAFKKIFLSRFLRMQKFYDGVRLDHTLGYFRVWAIPHKERDGRKGKFLPEEENVQQKQGIKILSRLKKKLSVELFAEDLGSIPDYLPQSLKKLQIPTLIVPRWQTNFQPDKLPFLSVLAPSVHDSSSLRGWWKEISSTEKTQVLQNLNLNYKKNWDVEIARELQRYYQKSNSHIVMHLFSDLLLCNKEIEKHMKQDRVNVPGTKNKKNWNIVYPLSAFELKTLESTKFLRWIDDLSKMRK